MRFFQKVLFRLPLTEISCTTTTNLSRVKAIQSSRISADKAVSSVKLRRLELDSFEKKKKMKKVDSTAMSVPNQIS